MAQPIILEPTAKHLGTVIFLHGLGDSGAGWTGAMKSLQPSLPHVKFILPSALPKKITVNGGRVMPAWFDVTTPGNTNDRKGLDETKSKIMELIENEVKNGIPSEKIVVGGFSQGAVSSIFTVFQSPRRLGGCVALSGYLAFPTIFQSLINPANKDTEALWYHGTDDNVLSFALGEKGASTLSSFGLKVNFVPVPGMPHTVNQDELYAVAKFIEKAIPREGGVCTDQTCSN